MVSNFSVCVMLWGVFCINLFDVSFQGALFYWIIIFSILISLTFVLGVLLHITVL